jgi:endo-1,4-beta-xylanase
VTVPTPKQPNGEDLQAEVVEDLYRLWFSAPNMKGVTYWNMGDSMAYGGEDKAAGGLVDMDLNPKKSYKVLDHLINEEWRTQVNGKSDQEGQFAFRGFYGVYDVDVRIGGITKSCQVHLSENGDNKHKVVIK